MIIKQLKFTIEESIGECHGYTVFEYIEGNNINWIEEGYQIEYDGEKIIIEYYSNNEDTVFLLKYFDTSNKEILNYHYIL